MAFPPARRPGVLAWLVLASLSPDARAGDVRFLAPPALQGIGNSPHDLIVADVDSNGRPDLLVATTSANRVTAFLNRGSGCFDPPRSVRIGPSDPWRSSGPADIDGDGAPDLVVTRVEMPSGPIHVLALSNDGAGAFTLGPETLIGVVSNPSEIVLVALDGDAFADVVVVENDLVRVFAGDGTGSFALAGSVAYSGWVRAVVAADFDGDGLSDVGCAHDSDAGATFSFSVFPGQLGGTLGSPVTTLVGAAYGAVEAADFDGDGALDVALLRTGSDPSSLALLRGDGAFGFTESTIALLLDDATAYAMAAGDLDGDSRSDLVIAHTTGTERLAGDATQGLANPTLVPGVKGSEVAILDFDGDGLADIVPLPMLPALADGAGQFVRVEPPRVFVGASPTDAVAGDFDGDGRVDVASTLFGSPTGTGTVSLVRGDGAGGFGAPTESAAGARPQAVAAGDLDLDGDLDLVVAKGSGTFVFVLLNDGTGAFTIGSGFSPLTFPTRVHTVDLNADGVLDLVTEKPVTVAIQIGTGAGTFGPASLFNVSKVAGFGDADDDGHWDVVCSSGILYGDGAGGFSFDSLAPITDILAAADMDSDGHLDLVRRTEVDYGIGDGSFTPGPLLGESAGDLVALSSVSWVPFDVDEDGVLDLVLRGFGMAVLLGDGARGFRWGGVQLDAGFEASLVADYDGDCHLDSASLETFETESGLRTELALTLNRNFDPVAARRGNVNAAAGPIVDVLFVNGSAGTGAERVVTLGVDDPVTIFMANAPSRAASPFVLYKWLFEPTPATVRNLPFGLGLMAAGPPFDLGCSPPHKHVWNNIGKTAILGAPTHPSVPAPSVLFSSPAGLGRPLTWYLQGCLLDRAAPNGKAAVTNGILLRVE